MLAIFPFNTPEGGRKPQTRTVFTYMAENSDTGGIFRTSHVLLFKRFFTGKLLKTNATAYDFGYTEFFQENISHRVQ